MSGIDVVPAALAGLWAVAGLVLARRRHGEPMGVLMVAGGVLGGLATVGRSLDGRGGDVLMIVPLALLPALGMHIVMSLPDGVMPTRSVRATAAAAYAAGATVGVALWASGVGLWPIALQAVAFFVIGMAISTGRYQRARGLRRQRMQWFGWAASVGGIVAVLAAALRLLVGWPSDPIMVVGIATVWIPIALVLSSFPKATRHIDRLLQHTVALAGLVGLVAVVYLIVIVGLGRVPDEGERTLLALSMAAGAVAALLFPATRRRLADFATRFVYGEHHAPDEVLRTFGSRMSRAVPMDELLLQASESLRKTFGLDSVEIWTGQAGQLDRTVSLPERGKAHAAIGAKELPVLVRAGVVGPAWLKVWLPGMLTGREDAMVRLAPIAHQGELLGLILVERRDGTEDFPDEGERVLVDLARTVGVALHNVQLDSALQQTLNEVRRQAEDLRASRERIVKSADEARRKLERDLHDGAQQHVVALAVKARLIKGLLEADAEGAKAMLDEMGGDIQEAVQQLRSLAHGIFPKLLMDHGLASALEGVAAKAPLPTAVDADAIGRYTQEIEAAVYFCCLEALQNAGKHAGEGASVKITLREDEGVLTFEVADDGAGFTTDRRGLGAGFVNMADRVGAAGGTVSVESAPGKGTRVSGRIPVAVQA